MTLLLKLCLFVPWLLPLFRRAVAKRVMQRIAMPGDYAEAPKVPGSIVVVVGRPSTKRAMMFTLNTSLEVEMTGADLGVSGDCIDTISASYDLARGSFDELLDVVQYVSFGMLVRNPRGAESRSPSS